MGTALCTGMIPGVKQVNGKNMMINLLLNEAVRMDVEVGTIFHVKNTHTYILYTLTHTWLVAVSNK